MDVSVIIVNYNTEKLILDCLDSIFAKTGNLELEVIVVDNASPNVPEKLKTDGRMTFVQSETNLGFGKANNLGVEHAKGKYIFCLNPDTILVNDAITELFEFIEKTSECGICGSNLFNADMTPGHSYEIIEPGIMSEIINSRGFTARRFNEDFNSGERAKEVSHVVGASLMIKKCLFDEIGGFNRDFFMYLEESYLCYEVRRRGYKIFNVPSSKIIHLEGQSCQLKKRFEDMYAEGRKTYYIKRYGKTYFYISNIIMALNSTLNIMVFMAKGKKEECQKWKYKFKKYLSF